MVPFEKPVAFPNETHLGLIMKKFIRAHKAELLEFLEQNNATALINSIIKVGIETRDNQQKDIVWFFCTTLKSMLS